MGNALRAGVMGLVLLAGLLLASMPRDGRAAIGTLDAVPGASLLYPYFEVDLADPAGTNTLLVIQNSSATAILAHTTIWTDEGVPAAMFNIYLTGFDQQSFSLRDVLNGSLPVTASAGQDPTDMISPHGPYSQDINFASCNGQLPLPAGVIPAPAGMTPADLRLALTGQPTTAIAAGMCWGRNLGDNRARGYVTVDTVNNCTLRAPSDAGYFLAGGGGDATNQNTLSGSFYLVNTAENFLLVDQAVSIEASFNNPLVTTAGNYTFYGRYNGWNATDNREPLAGSWAVQGETGTSSVLVWRDTKVSSAPRSCAAAPSYFPLGQEGFATFGPDSNYTTVAGSPLPAPTATQMVPYSGAAFSASETKLGLLYANFNTFVTSAGSVPSIDPAAAQSYVLVSRQQQAALPTSSGHSAVPLDNASSAFHYVPHN